MAGINTFVIIPNDPTTVAHLNQIIPAKFDKASYALPRGEWLVAYQGTTRQLSDDLNISDNKSASALVLSISSFWGRANPDIWEWFKQQS